MAIIRTLGSVARHQLRNARRALRGLPVSTPSFAGSTLDREDVELAASWLRRPEEWDQSGPVAEFEERFAEWNGSLAAAATASGREALSLAISALGLGPGDEVVIPAYTCVVVPNAFRFAGVTPRFCDIELETFGPDVESVRASITDRTRALVIQHLYGLVSRDYLELLDLAERRGLLVIEDCAHATGADLGGVRVGNRGTVGIYSSEQSKVFNTIMGGVAVANDPAVAERLRQAASRLGRPSDARIRRQLSTVAIAHARANGRGRWVRGDLEVLRSIGSPPLVSTTKDEIAGSRPAEYGCRMPAPIASLGLLQLRKVDAYNARRREAALRWDSWCDEVKLERPLVVPGSRPVFLRYPVIVGPEMKRNREWALSRIGVEVGTWFETHLHPAPGRLEGFPRADVAVDGCVNLPTLS